MSTSKMKKNTVFGGSTTSRTTTMVSKRSGAQTSMVNESRIRKGYGMSRTMMMSNSKKNVQSGAISEKVVNPIRATIQVYDDMGQDVTPQPLLQLDPNIVRKTQNNFLTDSSVGTPTDLMSQASVYQTGTVTASTFGFGPFTQSVFSASQSGRSTESIADDIEHAGESAPTLGEIKHKREEVSEKLTDQDLTKVIEIELKETDTIWLIDMPSVCVSLESDEASLVLDQNERYQELVKSRVGNDRYAERGMNTFNDLPKFKGIQTTKILHVDMGVSASNWDMHDTYENMAARDAAVKALQEQRADELEVTGSRRSSGVEGERTDPTTPGLPVLGEAQESLVRSLMESRGTKSSLAGDSVFAGKEPEPAVVPHIQDGLTEEERVMQSEHLSNNLVIMERVVNLSNYQPKQALYRALPIVEDIDKIPEEEDPSTKISSTDMGPNLDRLWAYCCPMSNGHNVSCLTWNSANQDLLAVGYGQYDFTNQKQGLVCCWSIKNPEYPERVFTCTSGVTAMDYSTAHPNLLAVGLYDGTVAIYNVRSPKNETVLDSFEASGKHTGPVWQLKWIEKERGSGEEKIEVLVSISQDGRVTQWSIRKGFESYDLMKLKRVAAKQTQVKVKKGEAFISRYAGGLCFDFSVRDNNIYLVGTEEGHIHKCSCSYNEQYLDTYQSHTGPVYSIQWSPFNSDVFLSCSGDWTVKLWHQDRLRPILHFHSSTKAVPDVCWSPRSSTVFACVNEGTVEVWDLSQNTLDPIIELIPLEGIKLSRLVFALNSDCILVGDSEGQVNVYQLRGMPAVEKDTTIQEEALNKIIQTSLASQLQK